MAFDRLRSIGGVLRRNWVGIYFGVWTVFLLGLLGFAAYFGAGLPVDEAAVQEVRADPGVSVDTANGGYVLRDPDPEVERTALVYYPGGRVEPESYIPSLAPLVEEGNVTVFVPEMPVNLAILDIGAAGDYPPEYPEVDRWYVGGHSLGGAMACWYASNNPDDVEGVVLMGAYCANDVSDTDLRSIVVTGTRDGVLDRESFADNRKNLPSDTTFVSIEGLNHTGFGAYFGQSGDDPATIPRREGWDRLRRVLVPWFDGRPVPGADGYTVETDATGRVAPR